MKNNTAGVGLIEIILSVAILGIGILGILQAFPQGVATEKHLEYAAMAAQVAQAKLEQLASVPYDSLAPGTLEDQARVSNDPASPFYNFFRTTAVALIDQNLAPSAGDVGLKKISLTVGWPAVFGGDQKQISLTTLVSKR